MNNNSINFGKLRTVTKAIEEIKKIDPNSAITKNYLRNLALNGQIRTFMASSRRLYDMDSIFSFFNAGGGDNVA